MISSINHITLAVRNIETSFAFYRTVLGLSPLVKWNKGAYFLIGVTGQEFWFCLNEDKDAAPPSDSTHYAFSVSEENFEPMMERLKAAGAKKYKENTSPGKSFYFLDPDGHKLEIHTRQWKDRIQAKKKIQDRGKRWSGTYENASPLNGKKNH